MNNLAKILTVLTVVLLTIYFYIMYDVKNNIDGKFNEMSIKNITGFAAPKADIDINFDIINNSMFSFTLKDFKVKVYDKNNNTFLTENVVQEELIMPKGVSNHNVLLLDNEVLGSAADFLSGNLNLLAVISFRVFGIKVEFEQAVNL